MFIVGPSTTWILRSRASSATSAPTRLAMPGSQVAAIAEPHGVSDATSRSSNRSPRTPCGPSETLIGSSPISGAPFVHQRLAPAVNSALRSSVSREARSSSVGISVLGTVIAWRERTYRVLGWKSRGSRGRFLHHEQTADLVHGRSMKKNGTAKGERSREAILEAALPLFAQQGFRGASLQS